MLEIFHDELDAVGFEMHSSKSKIMTSFNDLDVHSLTIRCLNLAILPFETPHLYLGTLVKLSTNICSIESSNRIRAASGKFAQHHKWLTNRQVPLHLRLKLFDSIVSPIA